MYLFKQSRPDIQLPVSFFTPRVKKINSNDWKKLGKVCGYLQETLHPPLTLKASILLVLKRYVRYFNFIGG